MRRVTQKSHDKGLIFREEITRYDVVTEISNPNPWPLKAVVHDQLPISGDRTVEIALLESSTPPRREPETGELSFSLRDPARRHPLGALRLHPVPPPRPPPAPVR